MNKFSRGSSSLVKVFLTEMMREIVRALFPWFPSGCESILTAWEKSLAVSGVKIREACGGIPSGRAFRWVDGWSDRDSLVFRLGYRITDARVHVP